MRYQNESFKVRLWSVLMDATTMSEGNPLDATAMRLQVRKSETNSNDISRASELLSPLSFSPFSPYK